MTTIEQAKAVEQRLRDKGFPGSFSHVAADTIASLITEVEAAQETIQHLNHALRDATEAPTFMGEPVDNELIAPLVRSQYQHKQAQQRISELEQITQQLLLASKDALEYVGNVRRLHDSNEGRMCNTVVATQLDAAIAAGETK